jgi:hypothetical protein
MKKSQLMGKLLSREQQKKVNGGVGGDCSYTLHCTTPNGSQNWNRSGISGDANSVCQGIYPAYGGAVSGNWERTCVEVLDEMLVC